MTKSELIEKSVIECRDLMKDAQPSTLFEDVAKELRKEQPLIRQNRRDEDWSILGHQIVGTENY